MANTKNMFEDIKKVHMIGIGGIGMSGIAEYLARKGHIVSGSDLSISPVTKRLEQFKVKIFKGHDESNVPEDADVIVYSAAVAEDNPEFQKALSLNKVLVKRAEALGDIVNNNFLIAVSGTHGKTTTTSIIAKVLIESKFDPTVFVGGNADFLNDGSSKIGKSNIAVVEADEYDRSFQKLTPDIIVITNIDPDHLDIYEGIEDIKNSFREFIKMSKPNSKVIACGDDDDVLEVISGITNKATYGFKKSNDYVIENQGFEKNTTSYVINGDEIRLKILGRHNVLNSAAAYLVAREFKISDEGFNESLKTFHGVKRRLELKFNNGVRVYDDYAHHPAEIKASIDAVKKIRHERIVVVFQPHLYSRTRDFQKEFAESLAGADEIFIAKIYPAREKEIQGVSGRLILDELVKLNSHAEYIEDKDMLLDELESIVKEGDLVLFQGAGDITEMCDKFSRKLKSKLNTSIPL